MKSLESKTVEICIGLTYRERTDLFCVISYGDIIAFLRLHGAVLDADSNNSIPGIETAYTAYSDAIFARIFSGEEFIVLTAAQILGCKSASPVKVNQELVLDLLKKIAVEVSLVISIDHSAVAVNG